MLLPEAEVEELARPDDMLIEEEKVEDEAGEEEEFASPEDLLIVEDGEETEDKYGVMVDVEELVSPGYMLIDEEEEEEESIGGRDKVVADVEKLAVRDDRLMDIVEELEDLEEPVAEDEELAVTDDKLADTIRELEELEELKVLKDPVETPALIEAELDVEGKPLLEVEE